MSKTNPVGGFTVGGKWFNGGASRPPDDNDDYPNLSYYRSSGHRKEWNWRVIWLWAGLAASVIIFLITVFAEPGQAPLTVFQQWDNMMGGHHQGEAVWSATRLVIFFISLAAVIFFGSWVIFSFYRQPEAAVSGGQENNEEEKR